MRDAPHGKWTSTTTPTATSCSEVHETSEVRLQAGMRMVSQIVGSADLKRRKSSTAVGVQPPRGEWKSYLNASRGGRPSWFEESWIGILLLLGGLIILIAYLLSVAPVTEGAMPGYVGLGMIAMGSILLLHGFRLGRTSPRLGIIERTRLPGESAKEWAGRMQSQQGMVKPPATPPSSERGRSK